MSAEREKDGTKVPRLNSEPNALTFMSGLPERIANAIQPMARRQGRTMPMESQVEFQRDELR